MREFVDGRGDVGRHFSDEVEVLPMRKMDDEGIEGGAFLGFEDLRHGGSVQRISGEAIDGLRRQRYDFAGAEQAYGLGDSSFEGIRFVGGQ